MASNIIPAFTTCLVSRRWSFFTSWWWTYLLHSTDITASQIYPLRSDIALEAIATSIAASGLGLGCMLWFILRYQFVDIQTFMVRTCCGCYPSAGAHFTSYSSSPAMSLAHTSFSPSHHIVRPSVLSFHHLDWWCTLGSQHIMCSYSSHLNFVLILSCVSKSSWMLPAAAPIFWRGSFVAISLVRYLSPHIHAISSRYHFQIITCSLFVIWVPACHVQHI